MVARLLMERCVVVGGRDARQEGGRKRFFFAQSDCERTAVAEDVLCTVINSRPTVIYGPTTAVL